MIVSDVFVAMVFSHLFVLLTVPVSSVIVASKGAQTLFL